MKYLTTNRSHMLALALVCAGIVATAFAVRTVPRTNLVFGHGYVRFAEDDPWYHVRMVENLLHHFPRPISFDPYLSAPAGQPVPVAPLFDIAIAACALIAGLGHPDPLLVQQVAAWFPAALGALAVIPVFLAARRYGGPLPAAAAGLLIALMPGQFLHRSLLGYTDQHVAEAFLTACCLYLFFNASSPQTHRRLLWAILAGVALALYLLTWGSGVILIAELLLWALVLLAVEGARPEESDPILREVVLPALGVAFVLMLPLAPLLPVARRQALYLAGALAGTGFLALLALGRRRGKFSLAAMWLIVAAAGGATILLARWLAPATVASLLDNARRLLPQDAAETISEALPFFAIGPFWSPIWREFTLAGFTAVPALIFLGVECVRLRRPRDLLLLIWSLATLALMIGQNRFSYYLAVGIALLNAFLIARLISLFSRRTIRFLIGGAALVLLAIPNVRPSLLVARSPSGPEVDWYDALTWLRANSPEPFGDPSYYGAIYPAAGSPGARLPSYSVMSWWDYGYWITEIGRRVPVSNPTQTGAEAAGLFFTSTGEVEATRLARQFHVRYVVTDNWMPFIQPRHFDVPLGKFGAMVLWAGKPLSRFFELCRYHDPQTGWRMVPVYYPDYFRSLCVRLEVYDGRGVQPLPPFWVASFEAAGSPSTGKFRTISGFHRFDTLSAARLYIQYARATGEDSRLVSPNPLMSCVPLAPLSNYKLIYQSPHNFLHVRGANFRAARVQIFENASP